MEKDKSIAQQLREMNVDPMYYFNKHKHTSIIYSMCSEELLKEPNEKLELLFEKYIAFEEELACDEKRGLIFDIGKSLLMNRHFKLAKLYFKLLSVPKSRILRTVFIKNFVKKHMSY